MHAFSYLIVVGNISYVVRYNASNAIVTTAFATMAKAILGGVNAERTLQQRITLIYLENYISIP